MQPKKNPAAVALGRLARGKPKNYTAAELETRRAKMVALNASRTHEQRSAAAHKRWGTRPSLIKEG